MGTLIDRIIEIATKANAAINVVAPGSGAIGTLGIELAKFIAKKVNDVREDAGLPAVELPPDDELIARMEATATRIVDTGQSWLDEGGDK